jgi:hypothetical protein
MSRRLARATAIVMGSAMAVMVARPAEAQTFETLGTRAAGMGGAFVAVADDATAVYWNPAGLALGGSYFSVVIETAQDKTEPDNLVSAGRSSANIAALTTPPLGLSYYRLSSTTIAPRSGVLTTSAVDLERLITHHTGVTLVHSLTSHLAVATTAKVVYGVAASGLVLNGDRDDLLNDAGNLPETSTTKFDADIGVMARATSPSLSSRRPVQRHCN